MCSCCPEPLDLRIPSKKANDFYSYPYTNTIDDSCEVVPSSSVSSDSSCDWQSNLDIKLPTVLEDYQDPHQNPEKTSSRKRSSPAPRAKRKPSSSPPLDGKERKKPGRKPGQVSNVLHLWEFMRDLLYDETISDEIIQWVSKPDGVFRVVNSAEVARLWGLKKNNKREMTYEKLSRSLRYSRLEGYFDNLPKDKNYPKKLCFKFGPKSYQHSNMATFRSVKQ